MNIVSRGIKSVFSASVQMLNQPFVKEGVKNIAGSVNFAFGLIEMYDIYQIIKGYETSTELSFPSSKWVQFAHKVAVVCAKISLVLSAGISRLGVFVISSLVGRVFTTVHLERVWGSNTIFTLNPWHPRHVVSIAAALLALPSVTQLAYNGMQALPKRIQQHPNDPDANPVGSWLTDSKVRLMVLFNTVTSRPALHMGNQIGQLILRAKF